MEERKWSGFTELGGRHSHLLEHHRGLHDAAPGPSLLTSFIQFHENRVIPKFHENHEMAPIRPNFIKSGQKCHYCGPPDLLGPIHHLRGCVNSYSAAQANLEGHSTHSTHGTQCRHPRQRECAPLNTAPQDIDFETYENYKEI